MPVPSPALPRRRLLIWYSRVQRDLPWRRVGDPYRVWVAEIMLQQTRVETVIPYYERFLRKFPTVRVLARASLDDVLKAWEGLGYYTRAHNLHRAAGRIVDDHRGKFPDILEKAMALPGIGRYTAGAILSIAYGKKLPVLDGNVERVFSRYLAIRSPTDSPRVKKALWEAAGRWVDHPRPGDVNQALMELGATVCLPDRPICPACPIAGSCRARALGLAEWLPVRKERRALPVRTGAALVLRHSGKILVLRRAPRGLLGGLWGFPAAFADDPITARKRLASLSRKEGVMLSRLEPVGRVDHTFTHFHLRLEIREGYKKTTGPKNENRRWIHPDEFGNFALSTLDRKILKSIQIRSPQRRRGAEMENFVAVQGR